MEEKKLIEQLKNREKAAWEELYGSYHSWVLKVIAWQGWNFSREEIKELAQEVFLEFYRGISNFRGEAKIATFLAKLARNLCISRLRKKTAQKRNPEQLGREDNPPRLAIDSAALPEEAGIEALKAGLVREKIRQLLPECRDLIKMRYYQELSYQEISRKLEASMGTIASKIYRCLQKLRESLEKDPKFCD